MSSRSAPTLDHVDQQLIALLRENARAPTAALARRVGLSRTTVHSRLDRLERSGVITGYSIRLAESAERGALHAYVMITLTPRSSARVAAEVRRFAAVRTLESVSGAFDLIAIVVASSVAELDGLIDAIGAIDGVERTQSSLVLSTKFNRQ